MEKLKRKDVFLQITEELIATYVRKRTNRKKKEKEKEKEKEMKQGAT